MPKRTRCKRCGCTDDKACSHRMFGRVFSCWWIIPHVLCSACLDPGEHIDFMLTGKTKVWGDASPDGLEMLRTWPLLLLPEAGIVMEGHMADEWNKYLGQLANPRLLKRVLKNRLKYVRPE